MQSAAEYQDALYRFAMSLTRNQSNAEDLVQETYLKAARAFKKLRPESNLKSWLFAILRNAWLNEIRTSRKYMQISTVDSLGDSLDLEDRATTDPFSAYVDRTKAAEVRSIIGELPRAYREVIVLREFEDFSYLEMAEVLDCPIGTVMSRLGRARERLREQLKHWDNAENLIVKRAS